MPVAAINPARSFTQAPLLPLPLISNLPPAVPAGSSQPDSISRAASDRVFANLDAGLSLARLGEDLDWDGGSSENLTPANARGGLVS
jgi:hypothetical protein